MEEYIHFMNRKNRKIAIKLLSGCVLVFLLCAAVVFLNTRYNGFADVHPARFYWSKIAHFWRMVCEVLSRSPFRLINFFN